MQRLVIFSQGVTCPTPPSLSRSLTGRPSLAKNECQISLTFSSRANDKGSHSETLTIIYRARAIGIQPTIFFSAFFFPPLSLSPRSPRVLRFSAQNGSADDNILTEKYGQL